jgi:beta-phosphoglucomutase family hydrolase
MTKLRRALLFDMDGVVVHNMPAHTEAWRLFLRKRGIEIETRDFLANTMGMPTRDVLAYYFKRRVSRKDEKLLDETKEALYRRIYLPKRRAAPGLRALLSKAHAAGLRLGLGTGSKDENVRFILDGLNIRHYFETVVGAGDVKKGKPNPETFLTLAERLKVRAKDCVVFEDSLLGEEAVRRAGMTLVAVTTSHKAHEFKTAALAVRDFRGLSLTRISSLLS